MSAKHTPGPLEISKLGAPDYAPQFGIYAQNASYELAIIRGDNAEADAVLFAAAPELLAALVATEARLTAAARAFYVSGKPADLRKALEGWKVDVEAARAAIAKAEGKA